MDDGLHGWRENQLRNLRPARHRERLGAEIDENDVEFPAVIGVERAGSIEYRDAEMQRESGAGPDLPLYSRREREGETSWDGGAAAGHDDCWYWRVCGYCGHEVEPGRVRALIGRERQVGGVRQPHNPHLEFDHVSHGITSIAAAKTNARAGSLWRLGVFLFVLKLDGAIGSKHHTVLLEVAFEEGWRRLLGARLIGIARQFLAALNIEVVGRGEHGHSRHFAISEGRYERRRTEQWRRLLASWFWS
jgi:hypothetical protein